MSGLRRLGVTATGAACLVGVLAGCGQGASVSAGDATTLALRQDMQSLASAANTHDIAAERAALAVLKADVTHATSAHSVDPATLARITASIATVQADLAPAVAVPTPTPTPVNTKPSPTPVKPVAPVTKGKKHGGDGGGGGGGD